MFNAEKLFQEYCVMAYTKQESENLNYLRHNQDKLRADTYSTFVDEMNADDANPNAIGRSVILPSSYIGGPRHNFQRYQDAMAVVRKFGKPDLFITMTANPKWPEIVNYCQARGQAPANRPDITSRVFKMKLDELLTDLIKHGVLGRPAAHLYVIEYQKRGLPHAHIVIIFADEDKIKTADDIDQVVCAELPDPDAEPELFDIVTRHMLHLHDDGKHAQCMDEDGNCKNHFPQPFSRVTEWRDDKVYPMYRRRSPADGGVEHTLRYGKHKGKTVNNRDVVAYSPYLSKKFNCHLNVEVCHSVCGVKYLYKYVYKGPSRAMVAVIPVTKGSAAAAPAPVTSNCVAFLKVSIST